MRAGRHREGGGRALLLALLVALVLAPLHLPTAEARSPDRLVDAEGRHLPVLHGGWYLWDPYQFRERPDRGGGLTGLDVEVTHAVARVAGFAVDISYRPWRQHIAQLRNGEADIAAGATWTSERAADMHYSQPYRQETNVLYLRRGEAGRYDFDDVAAMLEAFDETAFRLGAIAGFAYADPAINAYIADPDNASRIVLVENDYESFRNLIDGRIDGFLADRLVAATSAWRGGWRDRVEAHPHRVSVDIHFMFSKATVPPATVRRFDAAIETLEASGEMRRIVGNYVFPILLAQTLDSRWFTIFDIIGTVAFALSGVLIARREQYSILGALVLAALPAVGGGAMRDVLVGREPLAVLATPLYLALVGGTVLAGFVVIRALRLLQRRGALPARLEAIGGHRLVRDLYQVSDAVGIAAFTVTGVAVAVGARAEPIWLWGPLLAMLTAAGGGILRDLVRQAGGIASLKTELYAEVPLLWGLVLSLFLAWQTSRPDPDQLVLAVIVTMVGAFATRMTAVLLRLRSPTFA